MRAGRLAERVRLDSHRSPAGSLDSLGAARLLDRRARGGVADEHLREPAPRPGDELPRDREQDACAVAGATVGGDGSAVAYVRQSLERRVEDLPRGAAAGVGDEADPARVALGADLVER